MKVFVNTAFFPLDYEYRWYLVDKSNRLQRDLSVCFPSEILELMNTNYKSICLFHNDGKWILGFGALESIERKRIDCAGRKIRNSVILISESSEDTRLILWLSIFALKDWSSVVLAFDKVFEEKRENPPVMVVHMNELIALQKKSLNPSENNLVEPDLIGFTCPDQPDWIRKVENDLCQTDLAKIFGPILVFQKHESDDYFRDKKIWRGMGGLIKESFSYPLAGTKTVSPTQNAKYLALFAFVGLLVFVTVCFDLLRLVHKKPLPDGRPITFPVSSDTVSLPRRINFFASIYFKPVTKLKPEDKIEQFNLLRSILDPFNFHSYWISL